jgi:CheY-like chemotaxis protein
MKPESREKRVKPRLLVVEDDANSAFIILRILARFGYEAEILPDALGAIPQLESRQYNGAIIDLNLPGVDGLTLGARIRAWEALHDPPRPRITLILVTSSMMAARHLDGVRGTFDDTVAKPISLDTLRILLETRFPRTSQHGAEDSG